MKTYHIYFIQGERNTGNLVVDANNEEDAINKMFDLNIHPNGELNISEVLLEREHEIYKIIGKDKLFYKEAIIEQVNKQISELGKQIEKMSKNQEELYKAIRENMKNIKKND
jgi:hypothetical protein